MGDVCSWWLVHVHVHVFISMFRIISASLWVPFRYEQSTNCRLQSLQAWYCVRMKKCFFLWIWLLYPLCSQEGRQVQLTKREEVPIGNFIWKRAYNMFVHALYTNTFGITFYLSDRFHIDGFLNILLTYFMPLCQRHKTCSFVSKLPLRNIIQ